MRHIRFSLIQLVVFIGLFLNIERLDIGGQTNVINISSFVYALAGLLVVSTILIPNRWKLSTKIITLFWVAIYLIMKITLFNSRPIIGGLYTYISIVEIVMVALSAILTRNFLMILQELEDIIANITLADISKRVMNFDAAYYDVNKEFARSRRYSRPLGVVVVKLEPDIDQEFDNAQLSKDILKTMMSRYSISSLIRALDSEIRRPDLILEQNKENRIILLLPESNIGATKAAAVNIQKIAKSSIGHKCAIGFATFPNDALNFEDLVNRAENMIVESNNTLLFEDQNIAEQADRESHRTDQTP